MVKDQKLNVFLSQKTPIQLFPLCSLLADLAIHHHRFIGLANTFTKAFYYQTDVNPGHDSKVPFKSAACVPGTGQSNIFQVLDSQW